MSNYTAAMTMSPTRSDNQALFEVKSEELVALFRERSGWHQAQVENFERAIANEMPRANQRAQQNWQAQAAGMYQPPDPTVGLCERRDHHRSEAKRYAFRAEHVISGKVFQLSQRDLYDMGIPE